MSSTRENRSETSYRRRPRVAIDLVPIRVGEGGTGSGIWTYARELIHQIDALEPQGVEIVLLTNKGQRPFLADLKNCTICEIPSLGKNILFRLLWVHLFLPLFCGMKRVNILHKLATETPLLCHSKRITTVHDFYYEFLLENHPPQQIRLYERLEKFYFSLTTRTCFKKSAAIIAVSDATRQEAITRYPTSADRMRVIHHGAPPAVLAGSTPDTATPFKILCVAKFMEHKGQHRLIEAFERLLKTHPEQVGAVELDLRGFHNDGDYYKRIQQQIAASAFRDWIHIVPYNAKETLEDMYQAADLVVLLSSYEGFGLPVLEAQSFGVPVLCSDLPVLQEVGGAVYVPRDDVNAIAEQLEFFISKADFYADVQKKGLENTKRFRWVTAAQETLDCYLNVLESQDG